MKKGLKTKKLWLSVKLQTGELDERQYDEEEAKERAEEIRKGMGYWREYPNGDQSWDPPSNIYRVWLKETPWKDDN